MNLLNQAATAVQNDATNLLETVVASPVLLALVSGLITLSCVVALLRA
jgi:hypothetical protein